MIAVGINDTDPAPIRDILTYQMFKQLALAAACCPDHMRMLKPSALWNFDHSTVLIPAEHDRGWIDAVTAAPILPPRKEERVLRDQRVPVRESTLSLPLRYSAHGAPPYGRPVRPRRSASIRDVLSPLARN